MQGAKSAWPPLVCAAAGLSGSPVRPEPGGRGGGCGRLGLQLGTTGSVAVVTRCDLGSRNPLGASPGPHGGFWPWGWAEKQGCAPRGPELGWGTGLAWALVLLLPTPRLPACCQLLARPRAVGRVPLFSPPWPPGQPVGGPWSAPRVCRALLVRGHLGVRCRGRGGRCVSCRPRRLCA